MKEDIDQMKAQRFQAEDMIIEHINNVHQGPVVVRSTQPWLETPDTLGKYRRYVLYVPDPGIVHYLFLIVIYKIAGKGIEINGEGDT
jgi:hypothetical protein